MPLNNKNLLSMQKPLEIKFHIVTLGCSKNTVDSEFLGSALRKANWKWTSKPTKADVLLVNTCGFILDAKEESLKQIFEFVNLKKQDPQKKLVVFGCMIKRYEEEIRKEIPEIDFLYGFFNPTNIDSLINDIEGLNKKSFSEPHKKQFLKRLFTPSHYGYLKIAEGCDNRCSYCAIPNIRGPYVSRSFETVITDALHLAETGAKEIIIVSQDTTRYGSDNTKNPGLASLLKEISQIQSVKWLRLQYLHPQRVTPEFIDKIFSIPKVLPYFDIPFQHVSDKILERMNRRVTKKDIISIISHIRKNFNNATLRSTFIVGFPGEKEKDFQEMIDFIEEYPIDRLGAFAYSPEEGTPAINFRPMVPQKIRIRRLDELMTLQQLLVRERNQHLVGKTIQIIIDKISKKHAWGRSTGDSPEVDNIIKIKYDNSFKEGDFLNVRILKADAYDLYGEKSE